MSGITLILAAGLWSGATLPAEGSKRLGDVIRPVMEKHRIPGAVIGVLEEDHWKVLEAFGFKDLEAEEDMTAEVEFQVGSVTKSFTATLLALLVRDQVVGLDDPVTRYLPPDLGLGPKWEKITLHHLATHQSGLPREPVNRRNRENSPSVMLPYSASELLAGLKETQLESEPGTRLVYSNLGFGLLGYLLEQASGKSYEQLLKARILEPLRMDHTGITPDPDSTRLAACYWPEDEERTARPPWKFGEICAFGGLYSTAHDLGRFLAANYQPEPDGLIDPATALLLHAPGPAYGARPGLSAAMGWFVQLLPESGPFLAHGGEVDGHSAMIGFFPQAQIGIVVLTNLGGNASEVLLQAVLQEYLPGA